MTHLALVSCRALPGGSSEEHLLTVALSRLGIEASMVVWDDESIPWNRFDGAVIRAVWDYHLRPQPFAEWLSRLERDNLTMANHPRLVRWNMHKSYLRDLTESGLPVAETRFIPWQGHFSLDRCFRETHWSALVVKPAISASARHTRCIHPQEASVQQTFVDQLAQEGDFLVQPLIPEIKNQGELSLIYFGDTFSHAVLKRPKEGDFRVQHEYGGTAIAYQPSQEILAQTDAFLQWLPHPVLFARVDGFIRQDQFFLMELELIEPQLFLNPGDPSIDLFANACQAHFRAWGFREIKQ